MGQLDILKSVFEGKLGTVYGVRQGKKTFLKAIPFSHAPHNTAQKDAFTAFQKLVRFCSGFAKHGAEFLPINTKKQTKANALVRFFAPLVANRVFDLNKIKDIFFKDDAFTLIEVLMSESVDNVEIKWNVSKTSKPGIPVSNYFLVVAEDGKVLAQTVSPNSSGAVLLAWEIYTTTKISILGISFEFLNNKWRGRDAQTADFSILTGE